MLRIVFLFVMRIGQGIWSCRFENAKIANYLGIAEYLILKKTYAGRFAIFARIHPVYVFVNSIGWDTGGYDLDK